jgi:hypothetical protein
MSYHPSSRFHQPQEGTSLFSSPVFKVVVALVLLGIAGLIAWWQLREPPPPTELPPLFSDRAPPILTALLATHDACCANNMDKFLPGTSKDDVPKAAKALAVAFKHTILGPELTGDGWILRHCGVCTVDGKPVAHLLYAKGEQRLSVFSLSVSSLGGDPGFKGVRDTPVEGRPCISVINQDDMFTIIAHGGINQRELLENIYLRHSGSVHQP